MNKTHLFLCKYNTEITATRRCFDRVIFKGHVRLFSYPAGVRYFVDRVLRIRRKDVMGWAKAQSERIAAHAKALAEQAGRPYLYLRGHQRKDDLVAGILRTQRLDQGLVCVLACLEHCPSFRLIHGQGRPDFARATPPALVFYFYWLDPDWGLLHVRVPSLFPWPVPIAVNGHDYLARQLTRRRLGFVQEDNAFVELDDPARAQELADGFLREDWGQRLARMARRFLPLPPDVRCGWGYYGVLDQAEYATDLVFRSRQALAELYPRLIDHAVRHFQAPDILGFLGRRRHVRYDGEVLTTCRKDRRPGRQGATRRSPKRAIRQGELASWRIKHRVRNNWLKMYDKRGRVLRVETGIHQPQEFRVRRARRRRGRPAMTWCPMNQGVANLYHYQAVAQAANARYLQALTAVDPPPATVADLRRLGEPCRHAGRSYAAFNPARPRDLRLLASLCQGAHLLRGFRNPDIRPALFATPAADPREQRRRSAAVGRLLKRLHVRGLLLKIPHSHRWHLSPRGRELFTQLLQAHHVFTRYIVDPLAA